ncbi:30S ribosomal protein S11 [Acidobacteriia bacterium AH_259_A11_L15]|nr:30S ribosomal protein S11 [Acidobacteriia bacterium AH_259_A11_L15]
MTGAGPAAKAPRRKEYRKKREKKHVPNGVVHIQATFNNTLVTVTDPDGNVVAWASAGSIGFKGSRKGTPFAAGQAAGVAAARAREAGMRNVVVQVRGPGSGRESAVRAVAAAGLHVHLIKDVTPIPHNGCRPPKRRRV